MLLPSSMSSLIIVLRPSRLHPCPLIKLIQNVPYQSYTSEPHHQHQNYAEHCIGHVKDVMNRVLIFTGANLWILCVMYVVYILNITDNTSIGNIPPHQHLCGQTLNISPALCFCFYKPVYYSDINSFPVPIEKQGRWVGFIPNIGDSLTLCIHTDDTHHIIYQSAVYCALIKNEKNLHLEFSKGEDDPHKPVKQDQSSKTFILRIQSQMNMRLHYFNN